MNYKLVSAKKDDLDEIKAYKLKTIFDCASDINEEEKNRIIDYVDTNAIKQLPSYKMIVVDDVKVGCLLVLNIDEGLLLNEIYLDDSYRDRGIGTDIIKNIIKEDNVYLWVYKTNTRAIELYEKLGFTIIDETESRYYMGHIK